MQIPEDNAPAVEDKRLFGSDGKVREEVITERTETEEEKAEPELTLDSIDRKVRVDFIKKIDR